MVAGPHHATLVDDEETVRLVVESLLLDPLDQRCLERGMGGQLRGRSRRRVSPRLKILHRTARIGADG